MTSTVLRLVCVGVVLSSLAACAGTAGPATAPSTDVNPITGSRGGSGSAH